MNKEQRQVEVLISSLTEVNRIEAVIDSLPRGYISVKKIAGHTYYYRQWREKDKIISNYVPEAFLKGVKQKIIIRKENEQLLKITKKDLSKATRLCLKAGLLTTEQVAKLEECAKYDALKLEDRAALVNKDFPNPSSEVKKAISYYLEGVASYNNILLVTWGF
mgnify:CR=1 FL=1